MTTAMNEGDVRFYAKTADAQREWMEKINSALKRISVNDEKTVSVFFYLFVRPPCCDRE